jgi:DNA repair exonuclease SbcCD ATPase subunit
MESNTTTNTTTHNGGGQKDLSSVLAHIETLQKQLAEKNVELGEVRQREEAAKNQVAQLNDLNEKLSEAKREAMREDFNNKVRGWIQSLDSKEVPDGVKQEFLDGAENFIKKGTDNGAWKVCFLTLDPPPCCSALPLCLSPIC